VLATAAGVFGAAKFLHPEYEAHTAIWIDQSGRTAGPAPLTSAPLFDAQGWAQLLVSNTVLDTVVVEQHLWVSTASRALSPLFGSVLPGAGPSPGAYQLRIDSAGTSYTLGAVAGQIVERGTLGDSIGRAIGLRWAPAAASFAAGSTYVFNIVTPQTAANGLAGDLHLSINQSGSFLAVTLAGPSAARTAAILNAVATRYVDVAGRMQREQLSEVSKVLASQIQYANQSLVEAEGELQAFRVKTITGPQVQVTGSGTIGPSASDLSPDAATLNQFHSLQTRLDSLRADRAALAQLLSAAPQSGISVAAFLAIPAVRQSPRLVTALNDLTDAQNRLRTMQVRYTGAYPAVQALNAQVTSIADTTIPRLTRELMDRLGSTTTSLTADVSQSADSLRALPPRATEQARLMRKVALATSLYENLQQRQSEAQIAMASSIGSVHVLDAAVAPSRPTKNTTPRIVAFAAVAGLGMAIVLALILDRMDPRFRHPSQVTGEMGLAILGTIPHVKSPNGDSTAEAQPALREAIRGLRMNVAYAYGAAGPVTITLTSPGSRDGKSFISLNLARAFAEGGARTLLIDGDARRGTLHHRFRVARKPGLTDYLHDGLELDRVIRQTGVEGLQLIPSGTHSHDAPELLASPAMRTLMADLRDRFDVIVCDSPPLSAGIDAFALGVATANLLLVLRTGVSDREMAHAKLDVLKRMPVRLLGAVLNDVPGSAPYSYYSNYLPGYETASERRLGAANAVLSERA
jgi:capsular exopolysaccharide synthesis family protein